MNPKQKILIVEDSWDYYSRLEKLLKKLGYQVFPYTKSYLEAIAQIENERPQLALLDLDLDGVKNGIDLARQLKNKYRIPFFYLTAFMDNDLLQETNAIGHEPYMLKESLNEKQILVNMEKALGIQAQPKPGQEKGFVFVKDRHQLLKLDLGLTYLIEAAENYVHIHSSEGKMTVHKTMKDMEEELPATDFVRVHRKYIVRIDRIASIPGNFLKLNNGQEIPIGESYKQVLLDKLNLL